MPPGKDPLGPFRAEKLLADKISQHFPREDLRDPVRTWKSIKITSTGVDGRAGEWKRPGTSRRRCTCYKEYLSRVSGEQGELLLSSFIRCFIFSLKSGSTRFGSERLANFYNLSLRLEKMIKVGDIGKVYLMADIFNAFNSAIITTRNYREHGTYYVDNSYFRPNVNDYKATQILNPRVMRLGLRFLF
jgi:hypothetical protein